MVTFVHEELLVVADTAEGCRQLAAVSCADGTFIATAPACLVSEVHGALQTTSCDTQGVVRLVCSAAWLLDACASAEFVLLTQTAIRLGGQHTVYSFKTSGSAQLVCLQFNRCPLQAGGSRRCRCLAAPDAAEGQHEVVATVVHSLHVRLMH